MPSILQRARDSAPPDRREQNQMSGTEERKELELKRKIRPRFHRALIGALIISLILAVLLIMFLNRYLSRSTREDDGWLDRRTPVVAMQSDNLLEEDDFII